MRIARAHLPLTVATAVLAAALGPSAVGATTIEPRELAGWWIALDETLPRLWERGRAAEEILIVNPDGTLENRIVGFADLDLAQCGEPRRCSDAPLVARARLAARSDELSIVDRRASDHALLSPEHDPLIRAAALTTTPAWTMARSAGGRVLTLHAGETTRVLVKVEPDRLRRLRAGLLVSKLPSAKHWRCYLANATAADPAFSVIRKGRAAAPAFLDDFLKAASYLLALKVMASLPTRDDPDPAKRKAAGTPIELMMIEPFNDVRAPASHAEAKSLQARAVMLTKRAENVSPAEADIITSAINAGRPVTIAATPAQVAALSRALGTDAEAKRLFCRD